MFDRGPGADPVERSVGFGPYSEGSPVQSGSVRSEGKEEPDLSLPLQRLRIPGSELPFYLRKVRR